MSLCPCPLLPNSIPLCLTPQHCAGGKDLFEIQDPQPADSGEIVFTYDVVFKASDIRWASRWDSYLQMKARDGWQGGEGGQEVVEGGQEAARDGWQGARGGRRLWKGGRRPAHTYTPAAAAAVSG